VVLVKRMHEFLTNTTPSARLWSLCGVLTSRSHPSSAEEGSRAHPNVLLIGCAAEDGVVLVQFNTEFLTNTILRSPKRFRQFRQQ